MHQKVGGGPTGPQRAYSHAQFLKSEKAHAGLEALHETNGTELIKNILAIGLKLRLKNFIANLNLSKLNI